MSDTPEDKQPEDELRCTACESPEHETTGFWCGMDVQTCSHCDHQFLGDGTEIPHR